MGNDAKLGGKTMIANVEEKVKELVPLAIKAAIEKHIRLGEPVVFAEGAQVREMQADPILRQPPVSEAIDSTLTEWNDEADDDL